jgi:antitoxin HicB
MGVGSDLAMTKKNEHIGSSFESWLDEAGLREEMTAAAIKSVIARQLAAEMKKKKLIPRSAWRS